MTLAVGRLSDAISGRVLGTVFAVTSRLALTALHCVGDRETGVIQFRRVLCKWDGGLNHAEVQDADPPNDVALLRLAQVLPDGLEPIRLAPDVSAHTPFVSPGAATAVRGVFTYAASGEVVWPAARLDSGVIAVQLACRDAAAGLSLHGLSGAPVLVGKTMKSVGVVRWNSPRDDRPDLASGASVFAAPSDAILRKWPKLDSADGAQKAYVKALLRRLSNHAQKRDAASLYADVRQLLLDGNLGLDEHDVSAEPEADLLHRYQIDIETGCTVIGVRTDLDARSATKEIERQLDEYLALRSERTGQRYIGIVTDGIQWRLYHRINERLEQVKAATLVVDPVVANVDELLSWLEALLATGQQITPTPGEIVRKLGAKSPSYALDFTELSNIYTNGRDSPTVKVKRAMWAKLLTTASGMNFEDDDSLFINHTLLVVMAEVIGHAVVGFRPETPTIDAATIMSGALFSEAQIGGVVEADFFDWVAHVPGGERFVKDLARRITRFAWDQVEHDIMKVLYESIIPQHVRHRLGEYYTPDWLAEEIVAECVDDPLSQRVLDASCGSGTFLFHAVRSYITAAETGGSATPDIIHKVGQHVLGFDVHPVAVTLARVTYLLAIGMRRLQADNRPKFSVPVYLADSLRWGEESTLWSDDGLSIPTNLDHETFLSDPALAAQSGLTDHLKFPDHLVANSRRFDQLVAELADLATNRKRGSTVPSLNALFQRLKINKYEDQSTLKQTFKIMCELHDNERDHIWGYYVRNLARPVWLKRPENRVDVLVGNPPWLAYRYMTQKQQESFRSMSAERRMWAGASRATSQDLSALFVARCIELYLRPGGRFGYVMPWGVLTLDLYKGFRAGIYPVPAEPVRVAFDQSWDLHRIKPAFFLQSVGVVFGCRTSNGSSPRALSEVLPEMWSGRFDTKAASRAEASANISRIIGERTPTRRTSPYSAQFFQGAAVVPRFLFLVEPDSGSPLGAGAGRRAVRSERSAFEKKPWKDLPAQRGTVERQFLRSLYQGDSILPFRCLRPHQAVIPWDENAKRLLHGDDERLDLYPGLAKWWRNVDEVWNRNRSSERLGLMDQLDYRRKLSRQFPVPGYRTVYTKSGMYLAAAVILDTTALIDQQLYWSQVPTLDEARFLTAILNSTVITIAVRPLQARGQHNPRDFAKYIFQLPIPRYDTNDPLHKQLAVLAERSERISARVVLPDIRFEALRRRVRQALVDDGVVAEIDAIVKTLLV